MAEFFAFSKPQDARFSRLEAFSQRIEDQLLAHTNSQTGIQACLDDLLGAVYNLFYAIHYEYTDRTKPLSAHDMSNVVVRAKDMANGRIRIEGKWTAGVYFNNALFRLAGLYHRILKIAAAKPNSRLFPLDLIPEVQQMYRAAKGSSWEHTNIAAIYKQVNELKHTPEGMAEGRTVTLAQAVDSVKEILTLIEDLCSVANSSKTSKTWVAGVDGCNGGWVGFKVDLDTQATTVELVDLVGLLKQRTPELACLAVDIPIGLLDGSRACDKAARKLLSRPRGSSVFPAPCRAAIQAATYDDATIANKERAGTDLSVWTWGIVPKIKQVDDVITPDCQSWVFEVHPEVCFWALAGERSMAHKKKSAPGADERLDLLRTVFPNIEKHLAARPCGVEKDDLLDAAIAAWTALRIANGEARQVCKPERDSRGLAVTIWY